MPIPLTPSLVFFAVRSLARLGTAAEAAYRQNVRAASLHVRLPPEAILNPLEFSITVLEDNAGERLEAPGGDLADCFDADGSVQDDPHAQSRLIEAAEAYWPGSEWAHRDKLELADGQRLEREPAGAAGYVTLKQWADGAGPPNALARVGIALADIVLDFANTNPGVFGVGSNEEKLIAAVTLNLRELLPDPDAPADWRGDFSERVTSIFFQAGLKTLSEHADLIIEQDHLAALAKGTITPFVALFEEAADDTGKLPGLLEVRDTLFGPVAKAAVTTVIAHQTAFLGEKFDPEQVVGAVTAAVLKAAVEDDVRRVFGKDGLTRIYSAVLGVVAERPELFVKGDSATVELSRDLVQRLAGTIKDAPPPFRDALSADLAIDVIEVFGEHLSRRLDQDRPWEAAASAALDSVVAGLKEGLQPGGAGLQAVFSREQLRGIVKIVLVQAAKTPGMIVGHGANQEVKNIIASVSRILSNADTDLLSQEAWHDVVVVALAEAAKNPGVLFSIDTDEPEAQLAVKLLSDLLAVSSQSLGADRQRRLGVLLFGNTLRDAMIELLKTSVRNAQAAATNEGRQGATRLAERLNDFALAQEGKIGADQWLLLYRRYIAQVIEEGQIPDWTDAQLTEILSVHVTGGGT